MKNRAPPIVLICSNHERGSGESGIKEGERLVN